MNDTKTDNNFKSINNNENSIGTEFNYEITEKKTELLNNVIFTKNYKRNDIKIKSGIQMENNNGYKLKTSNKINNLTNNN